MIFYLALCAVLLIVPPIIQCQRINRRRDQNWAAIEAEHLARKNAHPLGNADRYFG